jgi:hypothetical protein
MISTFTCYIHTIRFSTNLSCQPYSHFMSAIQVIQTQNVSSFSIQFQIKAVAARKSEKGIIYAASGILLGQMSGRCKSAILSSSINMWSPAIVNYFLLESKK